MVGRKGTRLVGRRDEMSRIEEALERAFSARVGAAIALVGGPGMGKSRLIDESTRAAARRGFRVMRARGGGEWGSTSIARQLLAPFAGPAIAQELPVRVDGLYLMTRSGLLLERRERGEAGVDPDIFTGMLTAVSEFIKDSFGKLGRGGEEVEAISLGSRAVVAQHHKRLSAAAMLSGPIDGRLHEDLRSLLETAWAEYEGAASGRERWVPLSSVSGGMNRLMERWDGRRAGALPGAEEVGREIERLARDRPVFVCVDDVDTDDEEVVEVITALAGLASKAAVVTLVATRGSAPEGSAEILEGSGLAVVVLRPLDEQSSGALAAATISSGRTRARASASLREAIHKASGGLPLSVIALSRQIARAGGLIRRRGAWEFEPRAGRGERALRDAVRKGLLAGALERLGHDDRAILEVAAVAGEEVEMPLIAAVIGRDEAHVARAVHRIEQEGGVLARTEEGFGFAHSTVRDAVYESVPAKIRREYHREIAAKLQGMAARRGSTEEAAFHLFRAGSRIKAAHDLIEVGREASAAGRWVEARRLLELGLRCLAEAGAAADELGEVETDLARACLETRGWEECVRLLGRNEVSRSRSDPSRAVMLCEALLETGRALESLEVAEAALTWGPGDARLALSVARLEALVAAGECKEVVDVSSAILAEASLRDPGPETSARLLLSIGRAMAAPEVGREDEAEQLVRRAGDLAEMAGAVRLAGLAELELGRMAMVRGDEQDAIESLRSAADRLDRSGDPPNLARAAALLVPLELEFGTLGGAEQAARAWNAGSSERSDRSDAGAWLALVRRMRGSGDEETVAGDEASPGLVRSWLSLLSSLGPGRYAPASKLAEEIVRIVRSPPVGEVAAAAAHMVAPLAALDVAEWTWGLAPGAGPLTEEFEALEFAKGRKARSPAWRRSLLQALEAIEALRSGDAAAAEELALDSVSVAVSSGSAMLRGRALRVLAAARLSGGRTGEAIEAAKASGRALRSCGALGEAWVSSLVEVVALRASGAKMEAERLSSRVPKGRRALPVTVSGLEKAD